MTIKNVVIPLEIEYLQKAAKERGISRSKLVRVLMEKVVRDELVPKILNDDDLAHAETPPAKVSALSGSRAAHKTVRISRIILSPRCRLQPEIYKPAGW